MKIVMYTMKPRLRASPRHGGQGVFFEFLVSDPQRGRPSGVAAFIVHGGVLKKIPYYTRIVRFSGEILNYKLYAQGSFTPAVVAPPMTPRPEQVLHHHRSAKGRYGGPGSCPLLHRTSILNFISREKEFSGADNPG